VLPAGRRALDVEHVQDEPGANVVVAAQERVVSVQSPLPQPLPNVRIRALLSVHVWDAMLVREERVVLRSKATVDAGVRRGVGSGVGCVSLAALLRGRLVPAVITAVF
jgi:hypothetical protein